MAGVLSAVLTHLGVVDRKARTRRDPDIFAKLNATLQQETFPLRAWDEGLLHQSLVAHRLYPRLLDASAEKAALGWLVPATPWKAGVEEGTYAETCKALTRVFELVEKRFVSYLDVTGIQPSIPLGRFDPETKKQLYQWSAGPEVIDEYDQYPPHLRLIPSGSKDDVSKYQIFNHMRLLDTSFLLTSIVPEKIKDFVYCEPSSGATIAQVEDHNHDLRAFKKNIYKDPNIGDRRDWYTDEVFAQQSFTGNNPCTVTLAGPWADRFRIAAQSQGNEVMVRALNWADKTSLYVQDLSYVREACGVAPDADLWAKGEKDDGDRHACAPVTLFRLQPDGKLFPLGICIDYRGSMDKSVFIFNKRTQSTDRTDQNSDWAWRYAKTCAQVGDWLRHEVEVHLNDCHLVEEATIVAAHRTLPEDHLVYRLLHPHWLKTLAVNAGARSTLVPQIIVKIIGVTPEEAYSFTRHAYNKFDWTSRYVPNDLARRGFPVSELSSPKNKRFHNYAYGRMVLRMWTVLRSYVAEFLNNSGKGLVSDVAVKADQHLQAWSQEMRSQQGAQMPSFPELDTLDKLIDAVTLCIHIATTQHTAVNYLQEYYQSFVLNKPPALCAPLPRTLAELQGYTEADLVRALPINRPREWLLASHVPYLLSYRVAEDENLVNYAVSQYHLARQNGEEDEGIMEAARKLVIELGELGDTVEGGRVVRQGVFSKMSEELDDRFVDYRVMDPMATAVSILI